MTQNALAATDPSRKTILVVEDDESTAQAVAWHLSKAGFATSIARDGLAALTTLKAWTPDAVVLDLDQRPSIFGAEPNRDVAVGATRFLSVLDQMLDDGGQSVSIGDHVEFFKTAFEHRARSVRAARRDRGLEYLGEIHRSRGTRFAAALAQLQIGRAHV